MNGRRGGELYKLIARFLRFYPHSSEEKFCFNSSWFTEKANKHIYINLRSFLSCVFQFILPNKDSTDVWKTVQKVTKVCCFDLCSAVVSQHFTPRSFFQLAARFSRLYFPQFSRKNNFNLNIIFANNELCNSASIQSPLSNSNCNEQIYSFKWNFDRLV